MNRGRRFTIWYESPRRGWGCVGKFVDLDTAGRAAKRLARDFNVKIEDRHTGRVVAYIPRRFRGRKFRG